MDDTGRIRRPLTPTARRIVFSGDRAGPATTQAAMAGELGPVAEVDRAHLVMLAERGLVDPRAAGAVLRAIGTLSRSGFVPLAGLEARRGAYILYEDWLAGRLGERTAGILRTGRSRNDLNATVFLLRLRPVYGRLLTELLRLQAVLVGRARRTASVVMPAYTHYQAAVPITLGHYLAGVAHALDRDIAALAAMGPALDRCPLGAGAGGGTGVAIDPARTAALLGFAAPVAHSIDAVATREPGLRLLAEASVTGVTLSRLGADLLLWTTAEFGFLTLPDELVGSSSLMPQKRNPFLLEHVKGKAAAPAGAFVAAATAMHGTPFANSVAVGTEACAPIEGALRAVADAACLLRLVVAGARPQAEIMLTRAVEGQTTATALADELVITEGLSFREAHHAVGALLTDGTSANDGSVLAEFDPSAVAAGARYGAGPGAILDTAALQSRWADHFSALIARRRAWAAARGALDHAVAQLTPSPALVGADA